MTTSRLDLSGSPPLIVSTFLLALANFFANNKGAQDSF